MKPLEEKIFVMVDPRDDRQDALQRAVACACQRKPVPVVYVHVSCNGSRSKGDNHRVVARDQHWLDREVFRHLDDAGILYESVFSWHGRWPGAGIQAAEQFGADLIVMPSHEEHPTHNPLLNRGRWDFLGLIPCPLILVRGEGSQERRKTVVAAVNFQARDPVQMALNERIVGYGLREANVNGADLHVVNAYLDSMHYPDRGRLARETGLSASHIHVWPGYTDEVIADVVKEFRGDMVVMGTINQRGNHGSMRRGNTTARVLASLDPNVDVLVVP